MRKRGDRRDDIRRADRIEHGLQFGVRAQAAGLDEIPDELAGDFVVGLGAAQVTAQQVTTGGLDTFYLDGAVALLAKSLERLGSDAEITILAGEDHVSLLSADLYAKMRRQMAARFQAHHGQ